MQSIYHSGPPTKYDVLIMVATQFLNYRVWTSGFGTFHLSGNHNQQQ